jgi:hypothetical protein
MEEARSLAEEADRGLVPAGQPHDKDRAGGRGWMEEVLQHSVASWQDREKTWLQVFRALRVSTAITVSVFTLIAGLAMFNTLAMIVMEKTKDIAILRSMGYTRRTFLASSLAGGDRPRDRRLIGCAAGRGRDLCRLGQVPLQIRGIFTTNTFIVELVPWHYVEAVALVVMVMVASLIPARRAARLEPGRHHPGDGPMSAAATPEDPIVSCAAPGCTATSGRTRGGCTSCGASPSRRGGARSTRSWGPRAAASRPSSTSSGSSTSRTRGRSGSTARLMSNSGDAERTAARGEHIGFVFQFHFLMLEFTALENVMMPMRKLGRLRPPRWRSGRGTSSPRSGWATRPTGWAPSFPAASSSGSRSRGPSPTSLRSSWPTSPRATWTSQFDESSSTC